MYKTANTYTYSPSDLTLFMRSPFASWMSRLKVDNPDKVKDIQVDEDALMGALAKKGTKHELNYLEKLKNELGNANVKEITTDRKTAAADTLEAMQSGYKVIFQAYLQRDGFSGFADFLIRKEGKSDLGDYYYEAWDTKLSSATKPYFVMQLCCYSWMLAGIQGHLPDQVTVVLGNEEPEEFRTAKYYSYFQSLKDQFILAQKAFTGEDADRPDPALYNDYGSWGTYAKELMANSDSLALVANIRKSQISQLRKEGIQTSRDLSLRRQSVPGITEEALVKLSRQADLQIQSRGQVKPEFDVLKNDEGKGLSALPPSSELDVFFDIEGHPLEKGGLEYLWGVSYLDKSATLGKKYAFKDWWAHDREQEKLAFEGFIDWVYDRWQRDQTMHVFHYATYEITAINKLWSRESTRQKEVVELLKAGVFVDLLKIVKNGLLVGEPRYSIKNIEHLYRPKRTTDVANGGESVVVYENWREGGGVQKWSYRIWSENPDEFKWDAWPELKNIRDYNIDDCESTLELFDWLTKQQKEFSVVYLPKILKDLEDIDKTERQLSNAEKREALVERQQKLFQQYEHNSDLKQDHHAKLLVSLLHFYERERKPKIREYFERLEKNEEELFHDDRVLSNITLVSREQRDGKVLCKALYNNDQPVRTDKFASATIIGSPEKTSVSEISFSEKNARQGEINFVIDEKKQDALQLKPLTLLGDDGQINTENLENRLCEITENYFDNRYLPGSVKTLLNQANPNFIKSTKPLPINRQLYPDNQSYENAVALAVQSMDETCLCIQGPPGSGKTTTAKFVISKLIVQGKRVGVMSNSHAAIINLIKPIAKALTTIDIVKIGPSTLSSQEFEELYPSETYPSFSYRKDTKFTKKEPYQQFQLVGATAYAFVKDVAYESPLDYLFVDEAGQVALANLIAASGAAKNIILMGDQMQLEQPIQGSHPGDAGASALEFMLKGHAVIPEDKGLFLERTYRMHSAVCEPLSEIVYEGKLKSDPPNNLQMITLNEPKLVTKGAGILSIKTQHEGNTQSSQKEVDVIRDLIEELKTGTFTSKDGGKTPITDKDIMIVAPYNMQVNLLKEKLNKDGSRADLKIGTIDKFQGQEAPVVIISMTVSDSTDNPRGLDFIFDTNRLNVAVSRAKALAIIVSNEGLEKCNVTSIEQMEKVGLFCRLILDS